MLLRRKLSCDDIIVNFNIKYNVGDLLCAPFYWNSWKSYDYHATRYADHIAKIKTCFPNSILAKYYNKRPENEFIPNYERIRTIIFSYTNVLHNFKEACHIVSLPSTLTVHIRSGDKGIISDYFCNTICNLGKHFINIVLLFGIHNETKYTPIDTSIQNLVASVNKLFDKNKNIICYLDEPDAHLYLMMNARHLLIHRGGFSLIASLVTFGNLYVTNEAEFKNNDEWKKIVSTKKVQYVR